MVKNRISAEIHSEVAKYLDEEFDDRDDFQADLGITSDDLSAIALSLEKRFGVRIDRLRYRAVTNVESYAELLLEVLKADNSGTA